MKNGRLIEVLKEEGIIDKNLSIATNQRTTQSNKNQQGINDIVRRYNVHVTIEKYRKSIGLRLWSTTRINGKTLKILPDV